MSLLKPLQANEWFTRRQNTINIEIGVTHRFATVSKAIVIIIRFDPNGSNRLDNVDCPLNSAHIMSSVLQVRENHPIQWHGSEERCLWTVMIILAKTGWQTASEDTIIHAHSNLLSSQSQRIMATKTFIMYDISVFSPHDTTYHQWYRLPLTHQSEDIRNPTVDNPISL